jgi:hypothetical protein
MDDLTLIDGCDVIIPELTARFLKAVEPQAVE